MTTRRSLLAAALLAPGPALAQGFPNRPVRLIVPFAPGGATDFVARILQAPLTELLGQPVIIENRTGAAGNVGMETAARLPPDGYGIFFGNVGTLAVNPTVFARTLRIRPMQEFAPITLAGNTPDVLLVHPSLPVATVAEFVALARAQPGKLNYGSPGAGSLNRLEMELLREAAGGLDMVHVPYPGGGGPAALALAAGDVQALFTTLPSAMPLIQGGRIRPVAVTTAARVASLPQVPTLAESGFPDYIAGSWQGLLVPVGTPPEIIARLHAVVTEAMQRPDIRTRLEAGGVEVVTSTTPAEFGALIAQEALRWGALATRAGATLE